MIIVIIIIAIIVVVVIIIKCRRRQRKVLPAKLGVNNIKMKRRGSAAAARLEVRWERLSGMKAPGRVWRLGGTRSSSDGLQTSCSPDSLKANRSCEPRLSSGAGAGAAAPPTRELRGAASEEATNSSSRRTRGALIRAPASIPNSISRASASPSSKLTLE